jgi:glycosyltransferase involved in cell wall biosynthesis
VVLEALASGLPAVVVDRGGPPDQIAPGANGLIVRANHPASLADGVQHLLDNPRERERMGHAAAEGARHRSWSGINGELLESYAEVVRLHPRTGS